MSIINLLNQIKDGEIVLPAIQRNFVWNRGRIYTLLDSILRGYPVGIVLLWETYEDIRYRRLTSEYQSDVPLTFHDNSQRDKLKVVLDGQQRLQSLYVALYGKYRGGSLYFDVLSGRETDDFRQERFIFRFGTKEEADKWNSENSQNRLSWLKPDMENDEEFFAEYWVAIPRLFAMGVKERQNFLKRITAELKLNNDDELRVRTNLDQFSYALTQDENILKSSVIDENRPSESPERKSEADVLEIFVRINVQGLQLNRSDLIFSMLKLNWKESAEDLPEFVQRINQGNSLKLNSDFVIRCLFAVCDLGAKFDLEILRKKSNIELMKASFSRCCDAIASTIDFVQKECWCTSSDIIGGSSTLVPFVYYLFRTKRHQVPNSEIGNARKAFYLFGFAKPFSRYADSRLGKFIKRAIKPLADEGSEEFPFQKAVELVANWERIKGFDEELLHQNPLLALHVVQHSTGAKVLYKDNEPQIDHIFPKSILREKGFSEREFDHPANYWILAKGKNINKSNKHPAKYFADVADKELERALIDRKMLDYRKYQKFLAKRAADMLEHISKTVDLSNNDFLWARLKS